jgi:hypothetical protein
MGLDFLGRVSCLGVCAVIKERQRTPPVFKTALLNKARELGIDKYTTHASGKIISTELLKQIVINRLHQRQGGCCAICDMKISAVPGSLKDRRMRAHLDHDHETGVIRGLLCGHCNLLIGFGQESRRVLEQAIFYLFKHSKNKRNLVKENIFGPDSKGV